MAKGWVEVAQRAGRNAYRKVAVHVTNPDHLEPSASKGSGKRLDVVRRYLKR